MTLTYTIEIYRNNFKPTQRFIDYAVFVSFFPQLLAGPIGRANKILPQLEKAPSATRDQVEQGITLIIMGLFKKVMIGDVSGRIEDHVFAQPELYGFRTDGGLVLFSIQGYMLTFQGIVILLEVRQNFLA